MNSATLTPLLNQRDKLVLAREIIDLYYDDRSNVRTVESLSRICFTLARLFETTNDIRTIWDDLFDFFDEKYMVLASSQQWDETREAQIDTLFERLQRDISHQQRRISQRRANATTP